MLYNIVMVFAIHQYKSALLSHLTLSLQVVTEHWLWVPCVIHQTCPGYLILHLVMKIFQCYSFKSFHPLLPLSPKVCPLCLCLLCCPACRIVSTVFPDSIIYSICLTYSLCIVGSRFIHLIRTDSNVFLFIAE